MNIADFFEGDIGCAAAEFQAALTCIDRVKEKLMNGDLKEATLTCGDLLKSLNELKKLKVKKAKRDQLETLVQSLVAKGIKIEWAGRKL